MNLASTIKAFTILTIIALSVACGTINQAYGAQQSQTTIPSPFETALDIKSGRYLFDFEAEAQWFKIDLETGQTVSILLTVPDGANLDLYLYAPDATSEYTGIVASSEHLGVGDIESIVYRAEKPGFYYIKVSGVRYYSLLSTYELKVFVTDFKVISATWGEDDSRLSVGPGDSSVPLTVIVSHQANYTISSLTGTLNLKPPFSNTVDDGGAASFYGSSVQPGQTATFTFTFNMNSSAQLGFYDLTMTLNYYMLSDQGLIKALPVDVQVEIPLLGRPNLTVSSGHNEVVAGVVNDLALVFENSGTGIATSLEATLTLPNGATAVGGDNQVNIQSLLPGQRVLKRLSVYVSESLALSPLQISVTATYRDGYGSLQSINGLIGFQVSPAEEYQSPLAIYASTNSLTAGFMNRPPITIINAGESSVNSVEVSVSPESSSGSDVLVVTPGTERWLFGNIKPGMNMTITPEVFASLGSIDSSHTMTLSISYLDSFGNQQKESRTLGFTVKGAIIIAVQGEQVSPASITAGGNFTITGNLLNKGNIDALYSAISLKPNANFLSSSGDQYIGDITVNSPIPFSLTVRAQRNVGEGTYPVTAVLTYEDNYGKIYNKEITVQISVTKPTVQPSQNQSDTLDTLPLFRILFLTALVAIVGGGLMYALKVYRGRKVGKEKV